MKIVSAAVLILIVGGGLVSKADTFDFSGRYQVRSCKGLQQCVGTIEIRQTVHSIAIQGSLELANEQRIFFLPKLIILAGNLIDEQNHGKFSGEIGQKGFVHMPIGYKKFVVKRLPNGQIAFETSTNGSQTIYGIAEKIL